MANTSIYSKLHARLFRKANNSHPVAFFFGLLLATIPMPYAVNNIALMVVALASLLWWRRTRSFQTRLSLWFPVATFGLMALSLLWSIDVAKSAGALPKEIIFLALPVCFMLFPRFSSGQRKSILEYYGYSIVVIGAFYLGRAAVRFAFTGDSGVFFYHELTTKLVNAIHVSVFVAVAFFVFLVKASKSVYDWLCMGFLALLLVLLSSKNIIVVFALLIGLYYLYYSGISVRLRIYSLVALLLLAVLPVLLFPKISNRFQTEFDTAFTERTAKTEVPGQVNHVNIRQAWQQDQFSHNDYFPGTAFRVYQARIFFELLREEPIFWTGYGLNASYAKVKQKAIEHNLYMGDGNSSGYQGKNFHNQYIQNFADLGIFGLILLLAMLLINLKNGLRAKDFTHISFAVLMISLFLTESFLWRQRGAVFFVAMYCLFNSGVVAELTAAKKE